MSGGSAAYDLIVIGAGAAGSTAATANAARWLRADTSGSSPATTRWATTSASNCHLR